MKTNYRTLAALTAAMSLAAGVAAASSVQITDIRADWINPVFEQHSSGSWFTDSGNTIRWGQPEKSGGQQSGYTIDFIDLPIDAPIPGPDAGDEAYTVVGTFTHHNFSIWPTSHNGRYGLSAIVEKVDLSLSFDLTIDGVLYENILSPLLTFKHHETLNLRSQCPDEPLNTAPCADLVTVSYANGSHSTQETITLGGVEYRIYFDGFIEPGTSGPSPVFTDSFFTAENKSSSADIQWRIERITPIPLPAGAWLLIGGLGLLAGVARRKKATA